MPKTATRDDVLGGRARWSCDVGDALEWLAALPDRCVSMHMTSPPYEAQRTYGVGFTRRGQEWVDWFRPIVREMCRTSAGLVFINMASPVVDWSYTAAVEWLVADLTRLDGLVCGPRPYAWVKSVNHEDADGNGTPGSGSGHYQRSDWEPVYSFTLPDRLPGKKRNPDFWSDNTAFGHPPKFGPGGEPSHRDTNGVRANDSWGKRGRGNNLGGRSAEGEKKLGTRANPPGPSRRANGKKKLTQRDTHSGGEMREFNYAPPVLSNAGNVIRQPVGGGKLGHPLAHKGEAPMALGVAERFIAWFAAPDSIVGDPFAGTGTTAQAAIELGRRFIGADIRQSQVELTARRLSTVTPPLFAKE